MMKMADLVILCQIQWISSLDNVGKQGLAKLNSGNFGKRSGFQSRSGLNFSGLSLTTAYCSAPNCLGHFHYNWLTSSEASNEESNWVKSCSKDLRQTLARTLSLPLCGIPMMMLSTPSSLDLSISIFIAGIKTSQPSIPKRFSELHFLARKASNLSSREIETKVQRRNWEDKDEGQ